MARFFELTKFPKIYRKTYWGSFTTDDRTIDEINEIIRIIRNRNKFIETHGIVKSFHVHTLPRRVGGVLREKGMYEYLPLDHVEFYKTKDNKFIMVNSPYIKEDSNKYQLLIDHGFEKADNLYFENATTFIKDITPIKLSTNEYAKKYFQEHRRHTIFCDYCQKNISASNISKHEKTLTHQKNQL